MKLNPKIALIYLPGEYALPDWPWEKRILPNHHFHAAEVLKAWVAQTDAEYVLFWDGKLGLPSLERCQTILKKPGEVWHIGLLMGQAGQPEILNYLRPSWLLHLDASPEIASDSWRLDLSACLIKTEIIRTVGVFSADFSTLKAAGLEWGFRMFRAGALLRHEPELLSEAPQATTSPIDLRDALLFAQLHFSRKWVFWAVFRSLANGASWLKMLQAIKASKWPKKLEIKTLKRAIEPETAHFNPADWVDKVSVLMPTLDRYPYVINSLEQLLAQTIRPKEILITDQTPVERRWLGFAEKYPLVQVFPQAETGQCIAWNKLLEASSAPYVLFLGDDADGIRPDFLEGMCRTLAYYQADMLASNVLEIGGAADAYSERVVKMAEGFPITLIKKPLVLQAGSMDMAFNKGIRADQDLAIRCRLLGAHLIFDSNLRILHHRAPVGGLRSHQQRILTRHLSKKSPFKIQYPAASEYYLFQKHFGKIQRREHGYLLMFSQLFVEGSVFKKILRMGYFLLCLPKILTRYARLWRS